MPVKAFLKKLKSIYKMKHENEKYNKVLNILRLSKPELDSTEHIEKEVINRISKLNDSGVTLSEIVDFLFRWVYIGWIRRSLITASVVLVAVFVYQQTVILKQIDFISRQTIIKERHSETEPTGGIEKMLMIYKNRGNRIDSKDITISDKQMKELIESVNELQLKYKDLEKIIEEDPDLKKLIEKKLIENNQHKINL